MRPAASSVDAYLSGLPPDQRNALEALRKMIRAAAPQAEEVISYSMPMYKQDGQLVAFAAFKQHLSFFVCSGSFLKSFPIDRMRYDVQHSCIRFTPDHPIPATIVKQIVRGRLAQNAERVSARLKKIAAKKALKKTMKRKG